MPRTPRKAHPSDAGALKETVSPYFSGLARPASVSLPVSQSPRPYGRQRNGLSKSPAKRPPKLPKTPLVERHEECEQHGPLEHIGASKPQLIQEFLANDVWRFLIAVSLLNKTAGKVALPVFWELVATYPTPQELAHACVPELTHLLEPLGLQNTRASRFIQLSSMYLVDPPNPSELRSSRVTMASGLSKYPPTSISHFPGVGRYALDSFRIYSPTLPGGGAPSKEKERLEIWKATMNEAKNGQVNLPPLANLSSTHEEWRDVLPLDKELRRYLIWRWALDGYVWDPVSGVVGCVFQAYILRLPHFEHCLSSYFKE